MNTVAEVREMLTALEAREGKEAVHAWVATHANELPEDVRGEILFEYSVDAFLEDAEDAGVVAHGMQAGKEVIEELEGEAKMIEEELKKRDVKERLDQNAG